jgi:hypothetical protein
MLPDAVQGIEGTEPMYATRETRNVFKMPIGAGQAPARKAGNSVYRTLFLHMKDSTSTGGTFYARFTKDGGGEFNSNEKFGEDGFVKVSPLAPPVLNPDSYQFIPKRVKGNGNADKEDDFHFNLRTRDYWSFRYRGGDLFMREFLARTPDWGVKTDINKSMLRFENDHPNEIMVSYMGSIFEPKFKGVVNGQKEDDSEVLKVDFDLVGDDKKALTTVKNPWGTDVESTVFEPGTFVIVNDRLDDATYIPADQRKRLSQSMVVKFVDDMGNAHHVQFNYGPADYAGDRNNVNVALVTPQ